MAQQQPAPDPYIQNQIEQLTLLEKHYESIEGWEPFAIGKKIIPAQEDERIPSVRRILTVMGDYTAAPSDSPLYDEALEKAVRHFQQRHGLEDDGIIGKSTQAVLSVSLTQRIAQIDATLARLKLALWGGEKYIIVNIPAYQLLIINQGKKLLDMKVIVGQEKHQTPLFDNAITAVAFNPAWHVPKSIVDKELIPKLLEDPQYFVTAGFVITQDGNVIDPLGFDRSNLKHLVFRQDAGEKNALGKIKFNIPDSDAIYLHSTPSPRLFAKAFRALSHGCIRLEKPMELAYFLMEPQWDKQRIDETYEQDSFKQVKITPVPVHLVYWTAFVDEAGIVHFYEDVYGKDK